MEGPHYRFKTDRGDDLEFWAENGMITLIDRKQAEHAKSEDEYRRRIPPKDFLERAIAAMIAEPDKYPSKLRNLRNLLDNAKAACILAKRQGDPTDMNTTAYVARHRSKRSIVVPQLNTAAGQPKYKIVPNANDTAGILKAGIKLVPDLTI
jgi:hypothetical protein